MPASEITAAELLQRQGYVTGCFGKWDLSNRAPIAERMPNAQGFDYFYGSLGGTDTDGNIVGVTITSIPVGSSLLLADGKVRRARQPSRAGPQVHVHQVGRVAVIARVQTDHVAEFVNCHHCEAAEVEQQDVAGEFQRNHLVHVLHTGNDIFEVANPNIVC